ncbi:spore germination protein [Paenibacillus baekrokdamisoli]|uniref:Spore germination protein n=1 Tax=Paenibacillus baekrokdamisoli TaxID=1712516 RepID=A0A3G9IY37_9BACL|nr:spore germination protein [Paenibacillus baekrokdamisoli]MBB3069590.1 stage V sporulation protein AF [Paenibacillus baekrokdamisoli]BBH21055.1 spore germination protein [Paenibacillus baekrokdamisoli]
MSDQEKDNRESLHNGDDGSNIIHVYWVEPEPEQSEQSEEREQSEEPEQSEQSEKQVKLQEGVKSEEGNDSSKKEQERSINSPIKGPIFSRRKKNKNQETSEKQPEQVSIPAQIECFTKKLEEEIGFKKSFDVVVREMTFGEKRTALFFLNGFAKDTILTEVLKRLSYLQAEDLSSDAIHSFLDLYVPAVQVSMESDWNKMMTAVLSGGTALYIDGETTLLLIDAKAFPGRNPEEPSLEKVVRGSRDGFVETMLVNVTLVRRRLRDKQLRYEIMRVGQRTQTDVCVAYIDDIVDKELLEAVRDKIQKVKIDGLPLADKQLEEATVKRGWNPFPLVRYSERPDTVAVHLMEGHIALFVDTTPSVMIIPTTYFDLLQHSEENRQTPFIGTYLRWVRFLGVFASLFLLPLWFLFTLKPELKPPALDFIGAHKPGRLPMVAQFLIAEVGVDMLRMASIHTPAPLATAMSLISAILIGDIAVKTGLFVNEVVLYMAVAAIGMFATPSYELGLANRIVRLILIIAVASFKVEGFVIATTLIFITLVVERSYNRPYMWPLIPFDLRGMCNLLIRPPVLQNRTRANILKAQQLDKMPTKSDEK